MTESIIIIDFGSQVTKLIARRIREFGVFSEIISHKKIKNKDINEKIKGIILSGGPLNVYDIKKYSFDKNIIENEIPVLGICFGHQVLSKIKGGKVKQSKHREFGLANIIKKNNSPLIKDYFKNRKYVKVWMSHADQVSRLPKNFRVIASSQNSKFAIVENSLQRIYGVQFHPEVNLKMHLRWLYFAGYMLREKGAQKRHYQMQQRLSHGKKINMWLDSFLDNYFFINKS